MMKKLVIALAACVIAGAVFAQLTSQIVGYQTVPMTQNGFTATCATLAPIGMTGGNMLLGDIVANANFAPFEDSIQIVNSAGNVFMQATYVSQANLDLWEMEGYEPGWYDFEDGELTGGTLNGTVLPFGTSMTVFTQYANVGLMFVGEVVQSDNPLPLVQNGFTPLGNASPVDLTLGDITANEFFAPFEDSIQIIDAAGNVVMQATYVSQANLDLWEMEGYEPGWYDFEDGELTGGTLNSTPIVAGQGMTVYTQYEGAAIIIPNPLP